MLQVVVYIHQLLPVLLVLGGCFVLKPALGVLHGVSHGLGHLQMLTALLTVIDGLRRREYSIPTHGCGVLCDWRWWEDALILGV